MDRIKYPRTFNVPWSGSNSSDDVWWQDCSLFEGQEVVVTEKLDGECTSVYRGGYVHARSLETTHHPSRSWIKQLAAQISPEIPENWRICGENLFAWHSIFYTELPAYFFVFGIYDENNLCLPWDETEEICQMIGLHTVPVLYRGLWDEELVRNLWTGKGTFPTFGVKPEKLEALVPSFPEDFESCEAEGYVIRLAAGFSYDRFRNSACKYVRPHHVQTSQNWMLRPVVPNLLKAS